jgi:syntaxin 5
VYGDNGLRLRKTLSDAAPYSGGASSYYGRQDSTPLTPWDIQRMEQESGQDQMMQLIPDQNYLAERADAMGQVESHIVELGTIFNKLAVMVNEHRDMVQRVEDNVDEANSTINLSLNSLADTLTNLQTNRALFFKVFGILVTFIIMFIIFFA